MFKPIIEDIEKETFFGISNSLKPLGKLLIVHKNKPVTKGNTRRVSQSSKLKGEVKEVIENSSTFSSVKRHFQL